LNVVVVDVVSDFSLKLIDIEGEHLGIPDMEYKAVVRMPSSQFQRICRNLSLMGDTVVISATKEGVKFSVAGEEKGNITVKPNTDVSEDGEYTQIELTEEVTLTFALRYLNSFTKATPLSNIVTLSLSPDVRVATTTTTTTTSLHSPTYTHMFYISSFRIASQHMHMITFKG
jgi:proliferating cell nuclear antigen